MNKEMACIKFQYNLFKNSSCFSQSLILYVGEANQKKCMTQEYQELGVGFWMSLNPPVSFTLDIFLHWIT